jgi:glutamate/tyrosine decarboxylase-like PLP-dependent enzyme
MGNLRDLMVDAAERGAAHREADAEAAVTIAELELSAARAALGSLHDEPADPLRVLQELDTACRPLLVRSTGPRYFGFVIGGSIDAAVAADVLSIGWDQDAFNPALSPAAALVEEVAGSWLRELLQLPAHASFGFVVGGQGANTVCLAAARHHVLAQAGWDVEQDGLQGAPRVRVLAGAERHATIGRSLRLLGLGAGAIEVVGAGRGARSTSASSRPSWPTPNRVRPSSACRPGT